jgi:hypothetical protein
MKWLRTFFWIFTGFLFGLVASGVLSCNANADEHWSNYPRLPRTEMFLHDDGSWSLHYGGKWLPNSPKWEPIRLVAGNWPQSHHAINICQDSTITPRAIVVEFGLHSDSTLVIRDTTMAGWPVNLGVQWEAVNVWVPHDTTGGRFVDMIDGAVQVIVGVWPDGFCAHRVMRFYLEPHADRLAYQP